jgi:hypothetical protein
MGAAASVESPTKEDSATKRKDDEAQVMLQFNDSDRIDNFAKEMYLSSPKIDALQHVLSEAAGREAFMKFLRTEYAAENLDFFIVRNGLSTNTRFYSLLPS